MLQAGCLELFRCWQGLDPNVAVGDVIAVILETDVSFAFPFFDCFFVFVWRAIGVFASLSPVVEIGFVDFFTIEFDGDFCALAGDDVFVPVVFFANVFRWGFKIIEASDAVFVRTAGVFYLALNAGLNIVFWVIGAEIDAAVASRLEFHLKDKITEPFLRPNVTALFRAGEGAIDNLPVFSGLPTTGVGPSVEGFAIEQFLPFARSWVGRERLRQKDERGESGEKFHNELRLVNEIEKAQPVEIG